MTKPRDATSIEDALMACIGTLGSIRATEVAGKSASYLRQCSDPDNERQMSVRIALRLDLEMQLEGHGHPILDAYAAILEVQPNGRAGRCPMQAFLGIAEELGPLAQSVTEAMADGRIDAHERRAISQSAHSLIRRVRALLDAIGPTLAEIPVKGEAGVTVAVAIAMLIGAGYGEPQAEAIGRYMWRAAHVGRTYSREALIDPCAKSRLGEGLVDVTGFLRRELHRFAGDADVGNRTSSKGCVPAEVQIAYLRSVFPLHYPECSARFAAGDLSAFQRCWGNGASR